ncbi:MAG: hypothetical protein IIY21_13350 [Clostridiales bacterium]|nr:hypothetical protein [Clostridiales bacterium]MBQ1572730.1 hypothetical protein [Clostridiales bacterium]
MSRRDKRLDAHLDELVDITFKDGDVKTGVLEYGMYICGIPSGGYTLYVFGEGYIRFKPKVVKSIKEHE